MAKKRDREDAVNDAAVAPATMTVPTGAPPGVETRQQYLGTTYSFLGRHYGPGLVDVPTDFPEVSDEEQRMTEDATALDEFKRYRTQFEAFRQARESAVNDAGLAQPMSGEPGVVGTVLGSNQHAQTGVLEGELSEDAAGNREGDRLNAETPAAQATGTAASRRPAAPAPGAAGLSGADKPKR